MKKITAIAATGALLLGLAACSSGGSSAAPSDTEFSVGVTFSDLSNPVWAELVQEAQSYGAEEGVEVNYVDAKSDAATQVTQIENFIQQDVDAIIICAVDSESLKAATQKAQDAGIKIVGYTQVLDNYDAQYLVDAYETGYANGEAAAEWINENHGDEDVVEWALMDLPTFPEIIDRANGIKDAVEEIAPNAELVATNSALTAEEGVTNAENFLQANPDLKMIATIGGGGAQGGNEGVKASGITDFDSFGLFGIDATQIEIENIIKGDPQKSSISLGGGKAHGRTLIDITSDLLNGEEVEKDQFMPITVIDESNAQDYFDEMFGG
ncbi:sugar ABC transporter substrate-binding protein [Leucobacter manosquensis]|uniref:Sugar ABC transporter substrate-binding protein n=1 Tax=Leucobacter manosquensis TaxID=2810611 RepID=A0ABS5M6H0_9MICO|nr:sugar ABC transporter substrate-binding protein [Leucobacter manosquensis]MBS3182797.1 sugar ABC transporter substrate-binding protein [Leucobacter manosquensis]